MNYVQQAQLKLLKIVDSISKENNIKYWLDGGTLLGSVRNKGFIEWDNDLDLCFLIDDYHKIIIELKKFIVQNDKYLLYYENKNPHWCNYFGSIDLLSYGLLPVRIDLIPVINIPNNRDAIKNYLLKVDLANFFIFGRFKRFSKSDYSKKMIQNSKKLFLSNFIKNSIINLQGSRNDSLFTYIFHDCLVNNNREFFTHDEIFPLTQIEFEGSKYPCPNNVNSYLSKLYGPKYIIPPPLKEQVDTDNIYIQSKNSHKKTKNLLLYHQKIDFNLYKVRATNSVMLRILYKIIMYFKYSVIGIFCGTPEFFIYEFRYSYINLLKDFKSKLK